MYSMNSITNTLDANRNPLLQPNNGIYLGNSYGNYHNSFNPLGTIIPKNDINNPHNLIHDNVGETVMREDITEYTIYVESFDRDVTTYPDPFNYKIKFSPASDGMSRRPIRKNNKEIGSEREYVKGDPQPHITREFKNVKYIRLNYAILPTCYKIKKNNHNHNHHHYHHSEHYHHHRHYHYYYFYYYYNHY